MTQEEKARAYDVLLTKAKQIYNKENDVLIIHTIEDLFPELNGDEDEKIRKDVKRAISVALDYSYFDKETANNCLAWLKKQEGCEHIRKDWLEHIKQSWYKEGFIDGKYSGVKELTINDDATLKELIDFLENGKAKLQHDLTHYADWLKIKFTPKKHLE